MKTFTSLVLALVLAAGTFAHAQAPRPTTRPTTRPAGAEQLLVTLPPAKRTILSRTQRLTDAHRYEVLDQDLEWRGDRRTMGRNRAAIELLGTHYTLFANGQLWADRVAGLRHGFYVVNSPTRHSTHARWEDYSVWGTDAGGIDTAWTTVGHTNGDFGRWTRCTAANVRRGWSLEGANNYGNSLVDCGVSFAEVGIGDDGRTGSFIARGFNAGWVKTVLKLSTPTRACVLDGGDMEHCGLLFDVSRAEAFLLEIKNVAFLDGREPWPADPTRPIIGRFLCEWGLILSNIGCDAGKLPDGRWRAVIEVWDLDGVVAHNVCAELVEIGPKAATR